MHMNMPRMIGFLQWLFVVLAHNSEQCVYLFASTRRGSQNSFLPQGPHFSARMVTFLLPLTLNNAAALYQMALHRKLPLQTTETARKYATSHWVTSLKLPREDVCFSRCLVYTVSAVDFHFRLFSGRAREFICRCPTRMTRVRIWTANTGQTCDFPGTQVEM